MNSFRFPSPKKSGGCGPGKCNDEAVNAVNSSRGEKQCFSLGPGNPSCAQEKEDGFRRQPSPQPRPGEHDTVPSGPNLSDANRTALVTSPRGSAGDVCVAVRKNLRRLTPMLILSWFWLASFRYSLEAHEKSLRGGHSTSLFPLCEGRRGAVNRPPCKTQGFTPINYKGERND